MINLIQPITVQQAYDGITHARRWASWNWWWRMVDDDDGDRFPSPEPRRDSRSALSREFRAWRRLRIVKRDESFFLIFFSPDTNIWSWIWGRWSSKGPTRQGARPGGQARPHPHGQGVGPLALILSPVLFIYSKNILSWFSGHSENFYFCTKITPWQFCWKQRQSGLVPFESCKLESKTRAKVFGKVDTTETYHLMVVSLLHKMQVPCNCFTLSLCDSNSCKSNSWRDDHVTTHW